MKHMSALLVILAVLWWILSGYTKVLLISLGIVSVIFTTFLAHRMNVVDDESHPLHLSFKLVRYWGYLLGQIVISNFQVIKVILSPNPDIDPSIVQTRISRHSELGKVVLGNSVTLTPGTVTLEVKGDLIEAHALNRAAAQGVLSGDMDARVPSEVEVKS
jgi:multicomponent Na+:H+ antiporter subunit E